MVKLDELLARLDVSREADTVASGALDRPALANSSARSLSASQTIGVPQGAARMTLSGMCRGRRATLRSSYLLWEGSNLEPASVETADPVAASDSLQVQDPRRTTQHLRPHTPSEATEERSAAYSCVPVSPKSLAATAA
jgi:hypothetical protein